MTRMASEIAEEIVKEYLGSTSTDSLYDLVFKALESFSRETYEIGRREALKEAAEIAERFDNAVMPMGFASAKIALEIRDLIDRDSGENDKKDG